MSLLSVKNLKTSFLPPLASKAVNGVSFDLDKEKVLGIVGNLVQVRV